MKKWGGGKSNIADALTKYEDAKDLAIHNEGVKLELREGRHEEAPHVTDEVGSGLDRFSMTQHEGYE